MLVIYGSHILLHHWYKLFTSDLVCNILRGIVTIYAVIQGRKIYMPEHHNHMEAMKSSATGYIQYDFTIHGRHKKLSYIDILPFVFKSISPKL